MESLDNDHDRSRKEVKEHNVEYLANVTADVPEEEDIHESSYFHDGASDFNGDGSTGSTETLKTKVKSVTHYGSSKIASEKGAGYAEGISSFTGGKSIYVASVVY